MPTALPPEPATWQPQRADTAAAQLSPAAYWYFAQEWIAIDPLQQPSPPFWLAAPELLQHKRLQTSPLALQSNDGTADLPLALVPALTSNSVFVNQQTLAYLSQFSLRIRAYRHDDQWLARTLWPEPWQLRYDAPLLAQSWQQFVAKGETGAQQAFRCQALWRRDEAAAKQPQWAIGLMLNGAQGDDDEAHGGHFALTLGRCRDDGAIADWLVANFYNPDVVSEKGILPALVPMDNYLADLNSGQQQYRPSWLVTCTLADESLAAELYQQLLTTLERVYDHRVQYQHMDNNCTGLSMDALRAAGIRVPLRGPSSRLLAPLLYASTLLRERSLIEARKAGRYMLAEQTRLLPWQAFDATVEHLLALLQARRQPTTVMETTLVNSACALYGLHFPQLPSARPWGREPAVSLFEYQRRVPAKHVDWKIIPVPARELPAALRRSR